MAVYAVSDLHGQYDLFMKGLEKIGFSDNDELYFIGDAIDRGPDGIKILMELKKNKNMHLILGNHEFMMLNAVDPDGKKKCDGPDADLWLYYNGGTKTFDQYEHLVFQTRQSLLLWLQRCYVIKTLEVNGEKFCLTHSYYREDLENKMYHEMEYDDVWDIVWKSMYREDYETRGSDVYKDHNYTFITGHVPVYRVLSRLGYKCDRLKAFQKGNFIDIDGGCAAGPIPGGPNGALFYRIDDKRVFPVGFSEAGLS